MLEAGGWGAGALKLYTDAAGELRYVGRTGPKRHKKPGTVFVVYNAYARYENKLFEITAQNFMSIVMKLNIEFQKRHN